MTDRTGDASKRPPECKTAGRPTNCPHLVEMPSHMYREVYDCPVCGEHFTLYYEEMK